MNEREKNQTIEKMLKSVERLIHYADSLREKSRNHYKEEANIIEQESLKLLEQLQELEEKLK